MSDLYRHQIQAESVLPLAETSVSEAHWQDLCRLVDPLERLVERPEVVSLRLRAGQAWQAILEKEGSVARLVALPAVRSDGLSLRSSEGEGPEAEVREVALHLSAPSGAEIAGQGWVMLSYRAPLWIEHLLQDRPMRLIARYGEPAGRSGLLQLSGLVLTEASLPRQRRTGSLVQCRFLLTRTAALRLQSGLSGEDNKVS